MSATEALTQKALKTVEVIDNNARVIGLKKPSTLAQFRLVEILGPLAENRVYMNMVLPLVFVTSIEGDPVSMPSTKLQIDALIQRLDDAGVEAVMKGVVEHFGSVDPDADKAAVKN